MPGDHEVTEMEQGLSLMRRLGEYRVAEVSGSFNLGYGMWEDEDLEETFDRKRFLQKSNED